MVKGPKVKQAALSDTAEALAYGRYLTPHDGDLAVGDDYESTLFRDLDLQDPAAPGARFSESAFDTTTFTGGSFRRARWHDVWFGRCRLLGPDLTETDWRDVGVLGCSLAGVAASGSTLRRVTFQDCKIATLNLRFGTLREVAFVRCEIADLDLADASMTDVTFPGSTITRLHLQSTKLTAVDFRGAAALDVTGDVGSLRGSQINVGQLMELAPALAAGLGITVANH